jgi:hypothetical protein
MAQGKGVYSLADSRVIADAIDFLIPPTKEENQDETETKETDN